MLAAISGKSEIILYGWGRGSHENLYNAKRSRIILRAAILLLWLCWARLGEIVLLGGRRFRFRLFPFLAFAALGLTFYALINDRTFAILAVLNPLKRTWMHSI